MIEKLSQSDARVFGLKVEGKVTAEEIKAFVPQIEFVIEQRGKRKVGILADLSSMEGAGWNARWEEMRFLREFSDHIQRVAVVGGGKWEELMTEIVGSTVLISVDTRYFETTEIQHAWHWVKHGEHPSSVPLRRIFPKDEGLVGDYRPEYLDV